VAAHLETFAETTLASSVREALFYGSSAGCVAGVELHDRRRVVIKAYQSRWDRPFLAAARRMQERLTVEQRQAGLAAALGVLAYTARCEHALEAVTGKRVERARARLADDGWAFLS
jgi:hypothetical protein